MNLKITTGFTLIELIITVAIVGILTSIAYPSYSQQVWKARRADLNADILECAGILERHFTLKNTYGLDDNNPFCDGIKNDDYSIIPVGTDFTRENSNGFLITATAISVSGLKDTECEIFTFSHLGVKEAKRNDRSVNTDTCWRR